MRQIPFIMQSNQKRFCIFCGKKPVSKTNEHVIPQWLIHLTGDPSRLIQIGPFINQKESVIELSFNQFKFPACSECNGKYGELEERVKPVVEKLLAFGKMTSQEFDIVLDWFDKVRVGLWLGYHHFLEKNYWGIEPNFHISERIGISDRVLIIYKVSDANKRINFSGMNIPAFAHSPTCFTLTINNLFFTNVSTDFLVAKRSGLPYPRIMHININNQFGLVEPPKNGSSKLSYPILGFNYDRRCTVIAQPIFTRFLSFFEEEYNTKYIRDISMNTGKAKPIIQKNGQVMLYPDTPSIDWIPDETHDLHGMFRTTYIQTLQLQIDLLKKSHVARDQNKVEKQLLSYNINQCIKINKQFITRLKEESP